MIDIDGSWWPVIVPVAVIALRILWAILEALFNVYRGKKQRERRFLK